MLPRVKEVCDAARFHLSHVCATISKWMINFLWCDSVLVHIEKLQEFVIVLHDTRFFPSLKEVASDSSSLDLIHGTHRETSQWSRRDPSRPSLYRRILRRLASYWAQPQGGEEPGDWRLESPGQLRTAWGRPHTSVRPSQSWGSLSSALMVHSAGRPAAATSHEWEQQPVSFLTPSDSLFLSPAFMLLWLLSLGCLRLEIPFWTWLFIPCIKSMNKEN